MLFRSRLELCSSKFFGERLKSDKSCSEEIINEYKNDAVRVAFNNAIKPVLDTEPGTLVIDDVQNFNVFSSKIFSKSDLSNTIKSKDINKIETTNTKPENLKTSNTPSVTTVNVDQGLVNRVISKISKLFK